MRAPTYLTCLLAVSAWHVSPVAQACGGFFCSRVPVDQSAERVIFHVREDGQTEMVVQITYEGRDEDFAWVLPVAEVPEDRETFPQAAINALDINTAPTFQLDPECQPPYFADALAGGVPTAAGGGSARDEDDGVTVHVREEVGPYEVAVIGSDDAQAITEWLRDEEYNIAETMDPYIKLYTAEKMKFLALRLTADADAGDITPFKMTLPGETPGIPLRLTALAAEPEMGVKTWIFADQRFEPANAKEVTIEDKDLRWDPGSWGTVTNWDALVAREVDKFGGEAWVAEMAGDSTELRDMIERSPINTDEQQEARQALLDLMGDSSYLTRLYTRLAPEEMTYDPLFKRSGKDDVDRVRQLPYIEELCGYEQQPPPSRPCDYAACGALGLCRNVMDPDTEQEVAACACAPGATARTTFAPDGSVTISCQDQRLSFMNPGENTLGGEVFPDTCADFQCGVHGRCVPMNLTPTCECDEGYVARGWLDDSGQRRTRCVEADLEIPASFYNRRALARPQELPAGRTIRVPEPEGLPDVMMDGSGKVTVHEPDPGNAGASAGMLSGGGCNAAAGASGLGAGWLLMLAGGLRLWRRRR